MAADGTYAPVRLAAAALALVTLGLAGEALGCPTCKDAVVDTGADGLARGFSWSILMLIGLPFGLVGGIGGWLWYVSQQPASEAPGEAAASAIDAGRA